MSPAVDSQASIESIYVRSAALTARLLADQHDIHMLHGDIQHYNIRQFPRGWLAFDPWRVLAFTYAYACLKASWWMQRGGSAIVQWALTVAEIIEPPIEPLLA